MYYKLPRFEIYAYFATWVLGVSYSVYHIFLLRHDFKYSTLDNFIPGWSFLNRQKDASDYEWSTWRTLIQVMLPWIIVQILGSEFIRWKKWKFLSLWYFALAAIFLIAFVGPLLTVFIILQPCVIYVYAYTRSRIAIWIVSMSLLIVFCNLEVGADWLDVSHELQYFTYVIMAWNYLRAISFCWDTLNDSIQDRSLLNLLGYCFYLPTLFFGPLILYEPFRKGVLEPFNWTLVHFRITILNLIRFVGWMLIAEFILHYFYFGAMQLEPEYVKLMKPWALYGLGYCMGQFFMLKYTVMYGLSGVFAQIEHIEAPHHPKCIARIHLYSDMWRYFDQGLYFFLAKYIYVPCLGSKNPHLLRKVMASFLCFVFVYIWHSTYLHVFIWSMLNFLGVTVEGVCKAISSTSVYENWEEKFLCKENSRRFKAAISIPLFIMSAVSNFYFFAGYAIGNIYVYRLFSGSLLSNATLFLFCYCCCQVSIEVSQWEAKKRDKIKDV